MPPKKRHRPGVLPRLNFSFEELKDDQRQSTPTPAPPADASFLSNLASFSSSQRGSAADVTDDNNRVSASASLSKTLEGFEKGYIILSTF